MYIFELNLNLPFFYDTIESNFYNPNDKKKCFLNRHFEVTSETLQIFTEIYWVTLQFFCNISVRTQEKQLCSKDDPHFFVNITKQTLK